MFTQILFDLESDDEMPIAVVSFNGKEWKLKTIQSPTPEMMSDLKRGLQTLAAVFEDNGF